MILDYLLSAPAIVEVMPNKIFSGRFVFIDDVFKKTTTNLVFIPPYFILIYFSFFRLDA